MKKYYNKLVRDRIPEIIRQQGRSCEIEIIPEEEFLQALSQKLVEEANEIAGASSNELIVELADLLEVVDQLLEFSEIDRESVLEQQRRRQVERGGFSKRIRLLWAK